MEDVKRVPDFFRVPEPDPGSTSISDIVALIPPRPVATFLVNVFFRHATSFYYYVDKHWVKETLEDLQTNSTRLRSKHVPAACVVLMVLAVSTQYVHLETSNPNSKRGRRSSIGSDAPANWELDVGSTFYRQVAKSISELIHAGSLLSVQAFLLLGFYSLPIDASGLGYIYLNLAVKVAIQNGMHRRISRGAFDARSKEIRRRIWWTVYCMERSVCLEGDRDTCAYSHARVGKLAYIMAAPHLSHAPTLTAIFQAVPPQTASMAILLMQLDCSNPLI